MLEKHLLALLLQALEFDLLLELLQLLELALGVRVLRVILHVNKKRTMSGAKRYSRLLY